MSTLTYALTDSATMLRRQLRHMLRYPIALMLVGIPVVVLLLFVYVFGGTLGAGLGGPTGGRAEYVDYVVPGILLISLASVAQGAAITVAMDMTEGIIARFRTMAITRAAVLTGHVLAGMVQAMLGLAIVIAVALLIGFRPTATPLEWIAALGLLALIESAPTRTPCAGGRAGGAAIVRCRRTAAAGSEIVLAFIVTPRQGARTRRAPGGRPAARRGSARRSSATRGTEASDAGSRRYTWRRPSTVRRTSPARSSVWPRWVTSLRPAYGGGRCSRSASSSSSASRTVAIRSAGVGATSPCS